MTALTIAGTIQDLQKWLSGNPGCRLRCETAPDAKDPDYVIYLAELTTADEDDGASEQIQVGAGDTLAEALIDLQRKADGCPCDAYGAQRYNHEGDPE